MRRRKLFFLFSLIIIIPVFHSSFAQTSGDALSLSKGDAPSLSRGDIRLNQIGFYPSMSKIAVVCTESVKDFYVISTTSADTVFKGILTEPRVWSYSEESVSLADFSSFKREGKYIISVPGIGTSYPFEIKPRVHESLARGVLKAFYYQRASMPLLPRYAGKWPRAAGHPDTSVLIHSSAASLQRPENSTISSPGGWYDAADYNKYIVNSGISTYSLFAAYEYFPEFCNQFQTNIPSAGGNGVPDIINEALWNFRWMLTMQDPNDGGVYSKLTNENFDRFIMPDEATSPRYVVLKTTTAALDFAAVAAQASRITTKFTAELPGFSDSCLHAALKAWRWARQHPAIYFDQDKMNAKFSPSIRTGNYRDNDASDEFAWAASELFVTTAQDSFMTIAKPLLSSDATIPTWRFVRTLGLYTLARYRESIACSVDTSAVISKLVTLANTLCKSMSSSAYKVAMGVDKQDFIWGSNAIAANQGMELLIVYRLTHDSTYLNAALSNLDYLLGRNSTTYCFVTGFGSHPPMKLHHRILAADGIEDPVPGLLVGGPNPKQEDHLTFYQSSLPALSYLDDQRSFASNEICINWNAPLVFLSIGLESLLSPDGLSASKLK